MAVLPGFVARDAQGSADDEYSGNTLRNLAITFSVLEVASVALRFWSKAIRKRPFEVDDWLMVVSLVLCLGINAGCLTAIYAGGVGHHIDYVDAVYGYDKIVKWIKTIYSIPLVYAAACTVPKVVILIFYAKIFTTRTYRHVTLGLQVFVVLTGITGVIASALVCRPLAYMYDKSISGSCYDITRYYRWAPLPFIASDVAIMILPLPAVWSAQTSRKNKIILTSTFLVGGIGLLAGVARMIAFFQHSPFDDGTWSSVTFLSWALVEPGCYLFAACLICFRPLLLAAHDKFRKTFPNAPFPKLWEKWSTSSTHPLSAKSEIIRKTVDISVVHMSQLGTTSRAVRDDDEEALTGSRGTA